jgi:hypothetical protein
MMPGSNGPTHRGAFGSFLLLLPASRAELRQEVLGMDPHHHDAIVHEHEHVHVTHYLRHGREPEHELATHAHRHDHSALSHEHQPHADPAKEHEREAHVHDHRHAVHGAATS